MALRAKQVSGKRLALIIANDRYDNADLHRLRAPAKDAEALREVLSDERLGNFEVDVVRNALHHEIAYKIEVLLADRQTDDLVLVHFSGHGLKNEKGELFLAAANTKPQYLSSTAVDSGAVVKLMRDSRARRKVLFLDCCYGGAFERGTIARAAPTFDVADLMKDDPDSGRGIAIVTAATAGQFSFEGGSLSDTDTDVKPSIFTGALVEGLRSGEADQDQDGLVSLDELYAYVYKRVRQQTPNQTPQKTTYLSEGELVIASNPNRRVIPSDLPEDVRASLAERSNIPRLGAIDVLERLARGSDLPMAARARLELQRVADEDNYRDVATKAMGVLAQTGIVVSSEPIDFGRVELGAQAPVREVDLDGPPLAGAAEVRSSSDAVEVSRSERTIRIKLLTAKAGKFESLVTVAIAAGTTEIRVVGNVVPSQKTTDSAKDAAQGPAPTKAEQQPPKKAPSRATPGPRASVGTAQTSTERKPISVASPPLTKGGQESSTGSAAPSAPLRPPAITAGTSLLGSSFGEWMSRPAGAKFARPPLPPTRRDAGTESPSHDPTTSALPRVTTTHAFVDVDQSRPFVRSIVGSIVAWLIWFLSGVWSDLNGINTVPLFALGAGIVLGMILWIAEAILPIIRIPAGALWSVTGHRRILCGTVEGAGIGLIAWAIASATNVPSSDATFIIIGPALGFGLGESVSSILDWFS